MAGPSEAQVTTWACDQHLKWKSCETEYFSCGIRRISVSWSLNWIETHYSILAWRIPWTEEPDRLWSTGSQRVGRNWSDACTHIGHPAGISRVACWWRNIPQWKHVQNPKELHLFPFHSTRQFCCLHLTPKSLQMVTAAMKFKNACSLEEKLWPT